MSLAKGAIKRDLSALRAELYRNSDGIIMPRHPDRPPTIYKNKSTPVQRSKRPWEK